MIHYYHYDGCAQDAICPDCAGTGSVDVSDEICMTCDGIGTIDRKTAEELIDDEYGDYL